MEPEEPIRELARVAAAVGAAAAPASHEELVRSIAEGARVLLGAEACSIAVLEGEELVFSVVSGGAEGQVRGMRLPVHRGIAGWVVSSGQAIAVQEAGSDPRFARDVAESVGYMPGAILAMPLETERGILGVIEVLDPASDTGGRSDLEVLSVFATLAALAIEVRQAFAQTSSVLLQALADAADGDLAAALQRASAGEDDADLAELAAALAELGRLGARERRAGVSLVNDLLSYVRSTRPA